MYWFTSVVVYQWASFQCTGLAVYSLTSGHVYACVGLQVYWFTSVLIYKCTVLQRYWFIVVLVYQWTRLPLDRWIGLPVN